MAGWTLGGGRGQVVHEYGNFKVVTRRPAYYPLRLRLRG